VEGPVLPVEKLQIQELVTHKKDVLVLIILGDLFAWELVLIVENLKWTRLALNNLAVPGTPVPGTGT
jgi:hypothetical protein